MLPQGVRMQHIKLEPYALHPSSLAHAMPGMTKAVSAAVFKDLQAARLIDKEGFGRFPAYNDEKHMCIVSQFLRLQDVNVSGQWVS